jgi:hypothetical protein
LRCHGYSHFLEISSPGRRTGTFFKNFKEAAKYPERPEPFKTWGRRVTYRECPHIHEQTAQLVRDKKGVNSFLYQTSFEANFHEEETDTIVPAYSVEQMEGIKFAPAQNDYGIGLDGSGGGDETCIYVRSGPALVRKLFFHEKNTVLAADMCHDFLSDLQDRQYRFRLDDGGMSRTFTDQLERKGWRVERVLNQSRALRPLKFANRAAELLWHVRELYERRQIEAPEDAMTIEQLTTRKYTRNELGRIVVESKKEMRTMGISSPDRADAFVLCFSTFWADRDMQPAGINDAKEERKVSAAEFMQQASLDPFFLEKLRRGQRPVTQVGVVPYTQLKFNRI